MNIKRIRIYSLVGINLGGVTVLVCSFYTDFLTNYLNINAIMGILALVAAIQGLLSSLIYRKIKEYFPGDQ